MNRNVKPKNEINFVKTWTAIEIVLLDIILSDVTSACMNQKTIQVSVT